MNTDQSVIIAETEVREFARTYPTPNTLAALAHCESGRLGWIEVRDLFKRSLFTALIKTR